MRMAKASEADMKMAMDLCGVLDALGHRLVPTMPDCIAELAAGCESERFNRDDDGQCGRALRYLLDIADRGSLMRVVWGMAVLLDPRNGVIDPEADTLEHHPDTMAALAAWKARAGA